MKHRFTERVNRLLGRFAIVALHDTRAAITMRNGTHMDASFLFYGLAVMASPVVFVLEALLAMRTRTRYFAVPLALGLVACVVAVGYAADREPFESFLAVFTLVAGPVGIVCAFVAVIDAIERRSANAMRWAFMASVAVIIVGAVVVALDEPRAQPTRQLIGEVIGFTTGPSLSGGTASVRLPDREQVAATIPAGLKIGLFDRWVRLDERRRIITGRAVYEVVAVEDSPPRR
jgi:signal transduction histidine kinase